MRALYWIKRDFRLYDNAALCRAIAENDQILPLFIFEPEYIAQPDISPMHIWAWQQSLMDMQKRFRAIDADVLIATGNILDILSALRQKYAFDSIYSHEETGIGWTYERDKSVAKWCVANGVNWREEPQTGVVRGLKNRANRQSILKKRLFDSDPLPAPESIKFPQKFVKICAKRPIPSAKDFFDYKKYPHIRWDGLQNISESAAHDDLHSFLNERGLGYSGGISSPNSAFTRGSRLSVHLAWGTISLRHIFHETHKAAASRKAADDQQSAQWARSLRAFSSRLHWHDHFIQRLESAPEMEFKSLNPAYAKIIYEDDAAKLEAWKYGRTGFPIIDACMRCLQAIGFINFRMRAMVVSFAIFGLHLSWKTIHPHLAQIFLDYEPGIHISQLQMQAGIVGINTIRVYNPTKQMIDQDPDCIFIKQWIDELSDFSAAEIQNYEQIILGDYPAMIVDFKPAAKAMKDQIFAIRRSMEGKKASQEVLDLHGSRRGPRKSKRKKSNQSKVRKPPENPVSQRDLFDNNG